MYKIITQMLTPNKFSRPQKPLSKIKAIVIHWVANPNSSAIANRNFFENRKNGNDDYGSAHEIIDLNGDVIIDLPDNEMAYGVGSTTYTDRCIKELGTYPNNCTYSIECTHINWDGKMTDATYNTLVERCADLCKKYNLNPLNDLWTHQEVVGWKDCHRWFVNNPNEWESFKKRVNKEINMFNDFENISDWAKPSVEKLVKLGLIKGDDKGNFNPKDNLTREQFCAVIDRLLIMLGK